MLKKPTLRIIVFIAVLSSFSNMLQGQQLPAYTQYKLNAHVLNPAVSGAYGFTTLNMTAREQWAGFKGAPNTYTLSGEWRRLKRKSGVSSGLFGVRKLQKSLAGNVGLGAVLYNDVNGAIRNTGGKFSYAYHLRFPSSQLSLGAGINLFQIKFDKDNLTFPEGEEPLLTSGSFRESMFSPDASAGVYYLMRQFFIGLSANQLFQTPLKIGGATSNYKLLRHYYFTTGYKFYLGDDYNLEPSVLVKINEPDVKGVMNKLAGLDYQTDISIRLFYLDDYWVGGSYRTNGDLVLTGGVRFNQFYFAYSFDYALSQIQRYSYGSHEISVGMRFGSDEQKVRWLDRY